MCMQCDSYYYGGGGGGGHTNDFSKFQNKNSQNKTTVKKNRNHIS